MRPLTMNSSSSAAASESSAAGNGLRSRLKLETHQLHRQAERSGVMQMLLQGRADRGAYCALLRNLYEIYAALEDGLEMHFDHPQVRPIVFRALFRVGHLESDLRVLCGSDWSNGAAVRPAAIAYRERLNQLASARPELLVAHAYVRYLCDLSGGQILHRLIAEQFRLGDDATRFYQFGAAADVDLLLAHFRNGLDAIPVTQADEDAIVSEAQEAFRRHVEIFQELASRPAAS